MMVIFKKIVTLQLTNDFKCFLRINLFTGTFGFQILVNCLHRIIIRSIIKIWNGSMPILTVTEMKCCTGCKQKSNGDFPDNCRRGVHPFRQVFLKNKYSFIISFLLHSDWYFWLRNSKASMWDDLLCFIKNITTNMVNVSFYQFTDKFKMYICT